MNARERFHATFEYGQPDRVFLMSQWAFNDTRQRWLREGMPWDVHFNTYFGFDRMELIPLWLEANVNFIYPLEVASDCDAVRYRKQFGKEARLLGNIDKRALRDGCTKKDIEDEVLSKVPQLVKDGGFSPMVDHAVPPDVPFDNFKYYIDLIHEVCTFG